MKRVMRALACAGMLALAGCAIGNTHQYAVTNMALPVQGVASTQIAVGVQDQRPYVVSGNKAPSFVGLQRGGFGNPFDVNTSSGRPLAEDMRLSITGALQRVGATVMPVTVATRADAATARRALAATGAARSLLLSISEWKADTLANTALYFDLRLEVLDRAGQTIGQAELRGRDNLGGSALNPPAHANAAVPAAYQRKIEELFAAPSVQAALRAEGSVMQAPQMVPAAVVQGPASTPEAPRRTDITDAICPPAGTRATYAARERGSVVSILQVHRGAAPNQPRICMIGTFGWAFGLRPIGAENWAQFNQEMAALEPLAIGRQVGLSFRANAADTGQWHPYEMHFTVTGREFITVAGQNWDAWVISLRSTGGANNNHSSETRLWRDTKTGLLLRVAVIYTNGVTALTSRELTDVQMPAPRQTAP